jgi:hypothetical protein
MSVTLAATLKPEMKNERMKQEAYNNILFKYIF